MSTPKSLFIVALVALCLNALSNVSGQTTVDHNPKFVVNNASVLAAPRVRFAILGDRTGGHVPGLYEKAVAEIVRLQPDFVLTVGDQIEGYTEDTATLNSEWQEYFAIVKPLTMPLYLTPGNHDITSDGQLPMFKRYVGEPYRSFDIGDLHFVIVDVSRWEASAQIPGEQLKWLASDLAANMKAKFTLVFFHKPFWYNSLAVGKPDTLHTLFVKYGVDAVFAGHFHQYFSGIFDGIKYTGIGSTGAEIDSDPTGVGNHFAWVTVDTAIEIAPVKVGSVLPWDEVSAADLHAIDHIQQNAVTFAASVPLTEAGATESGTLSAVVTNLAKDAPISDTIRWSNVDNWTIEPSVMPVTVAPGGTSIVEFKATRNGKVFPVPWLSVGVPFKPGKSVAVTKWLPVARQAVCARVSAAPTIDGKITETIWQRPITRLYSGDSTVIDSAYYYFAYDRANLYVAVHCKESHMESLAAAITQRDGAIFGEDCVGFFFQPNLKKDTVYQVYFSALGTVFDQKISQTTPGYYGGDRSWNGSCEVKTTRSGDGWDVELRIPLKQFGISAKSGDQWGMNFRRKQKRLNSGAEWQTPVDYNPKTFGVLRFE